MKVDTSAVDLSKLVVKPPTQEERTHAELIVEQPEDNVESLRKELREARVEAEQAYKGLMAWQDWARKVLPASDVLPDDHHARLCVEGIIAKRTNKLPPKIPMTIGGEHYEVAMTVVDIKTLLFNVLDAEESTGVAGQEYTVELDGKEYVCDAELFARFIFYFAGGSLRIGNEGDGP